MRPVFMQAQEVCGPALSKYAEINDQMCCREPVAPCVREMPSRYASSSVSDGLRTELSSPLVEPL